MSLFDLSMEYERMKMECSRAKLDREQLLEWFIKVEDDLRYMRDEVNERLRLLTYLALENHTAAARAPVLPHWTAEQRAALRRGLSSRKIYSEACEVDPQAFAALSRSPRFSKFMEM